MVSCDCLVDAVDQADMEVARGGEIAFVGEIRPLAHVDGADRFRHQPVQVRIALAMGMGAHVDRHVVDPDRHVGAVVEIIAAQKILVGFALAAVLGHDQAGNRFEDFSGPRHRRRIDLGARYGHLARHARGRNRSLGDDRRAVVRSERRGGLSRRRRGRGARSAARAGGARVCGADLRMRMVRMPGRPQLACSLNGELGERLTGFVRRHRWQGRLVG